MDVVALEFASGRALFYGLAITGIALGLRPLIKHKVGRSAVRIGSITGVVVVILSATPIPFWLYGLWGLFAIAAIVTWELRHRKAKQFGWSAFVAFAGLSLTIGLLELPQQLMPEVPPVGGKKVYVIGDSISVAWEEGTGAWPDVLRRKHGLNITNLAESGSTTSGAIRQAAKIPPGEAYVLLEIGGNDLLGAGDASAFETDLDTLLQHLSGPGRTLVMLELPLPPFRQDFGIVQRRLAAKHGVTLIPKRIFTRVLGGPGATADGLHLSPSGQELMADTLWEVLTSTSD